MDLDEYRSAAIEIAAYVKKRGKTSQFWMETLSRGLYGAGTGYKYYDTQAWATLKKCWKGFIAKSHGNEDKMWYAKGIMKFQKQLGLGVRPFPDLGL